MKRILVTGGAGFVGSHLCKRLIKEGNEVICLDNFFTGNKKNVKDLLNNINFELVRHDICEPYFAEVDEIYHLACPASPVHYQYNPIKTLKTSVIGSLNILGLAKRTNSKVLLASSSEVYGDPKVHPQNENYWGNVNPIGIRSCYDEGKRCAETLFSDYHRTHNLKIKIIRIFNTYGPNMNPEDGRVVSNFINQAISGDDITIYGDGSQTRSFQYVDDLVEGMIRTMNTSEEFTGPVNLGNTNEFTILELADTILSKVESKSKLIFEPLPSDDPMQRKPDISLAYNKLDSWKPVMELDEGLKKTIKYFEGLIKL